MTFLKLSFGPADRRHGPFPTYAYGSALVKELLKNRGICGVIFALCLCTMSLAKADPIIYLVTVDTSSISGTAGSLDFNFDPGPFVTQSASLQILNFASNGSLANCIGNVQGFCSTGDVDGQLPGTLTFVNTGLNDYFDDFTFGTTLSFDLSLFGPAVSSPDGVSTSGSTFVFTIFSDTAGTIPALTNNTTNGFAFTVDLNLAGTATVTNFSPQTSVIPEVSSTPESGTFLLMMIAVLGFGLAAFAQQGRWCAAPVDQEPSQR